MLTALKYLLQLFANYSNTFVWTGNESIPQINYLFQYFILFYYYLFFFPPFFNLVTTLFYFPYKIILVLGIICLDR